MKLFKQYIPLTVAAAMLLSQGAYAETTVNPFVDDINNKLTVSGSFDNIKKDWVALSVYEGKYTEDEINAMTDVELSSKLKYFRQAEFSGGEYNFDFEFSQAAGWYTVMVSAFEDNIPKVKEVYYYQATDMAGVVDEYNQKIAKPSADYVPTADGPLAIALADFINQYKYSCFSDIKHFYDLSVEAQRDVARSQIGMTNLSMISEIKARVEEKTILRMMSEKLNASAYDGAECVSFIENNAEKMQVANTAEYATFKSADSAFKLRVTQRMQGEKMDTVPSKFRESVVLTQIEKVANVDNVTAILASAETSLGLNLSKYNAFYAKNAVNQALAGTSIESIAQMLSKINSVIDNYKAPNDATGGGSGGGGGAGGGGGSGGGWKKPENNVDIVYPVGGNEIEDTGVKSNFTDFNDSHWAYKAVDYLKSYGIVSGYSDGTFKPENNITRAEFVKMIVSALELETGNYTEGFSDVSGSDWFAPYVALAEHYNIVYGNENGEFRPNENITRQDAAVIAYRGAMFLGTAFSAVGSGSAFADADSIADYASAQVEILKANGILSGDGGYFNPTAFATRAQMSQMIYSLLMRI